VKISDKHKNMGNDSNPTLLTASATTALKSCLLYGISINATLTGTVTIKEGSTSVGAFAATTPPGMYWILPNGTRFAALNIALSTTDNVTAFTRVQ
jgi:hypothetical protein